MGTVIARVLPECRWRGFGAVLYEKGLDHVRLVRDCVLDGETDLWIDLRLESPVGG
ncbi:hypothetical protein [Streptomyces lincolnensis]|uniref:hypothetical protein n=1 Tax=Streptomyces lincolnensis TaxID=1915 RepID=UPI0037CD6EDE